MYKEFKKEFNEEKTKHQTHHINIKHATDIKDVKVNTGSVKLDVKDDKIAANFSGGEYKRRELVSGEVIPSKTKYVTNQTSQYYSDGDGYKGNLSKYLHSGEYIPKDTKFVTNQPSSEYDKDGYKGTLSKYVHSGKYTPAHTSNVSLSTETNESNKYFGYTRKVDSSSVNYFKETLDVYFTNIRHEDDHVRISATIRKITSHKNSLCDGGIIVMKKEDWDNLKDDDIVKFRFRFVSTTDDHYPEIYVKQRRMKTEYFEIKAKDLKSVRLSSRDYYSTNSIVTDMSDLGGNIWKEDGSAGNYYAYFEVYLDDVMYSRDVPESDTRVWRYQGDVTKPEVDTRVWRYQGNVTRPEQDTRVWDYYYQYSLEFLYRSKDYVGKNFHKFENHLKDIMLIESSSLYKGFDMPDKAKNGSIIYNKKDKTIYLYNDGWKKLKTREIK